MKILIASHNIIKGDGQGRVNYELATYLANHDHQVTLLADRVDETLAQQPNIKWQPLTPLIAKPNLLKGILWANQCTSYLKKNSQHFDIIHLNGALAYCPHHVNTCHFVHHSFAQYLTKERFPGLRGYYHQLYSYINAKLEKKVYDLAQNVVAVSPKTKRELTQLAGISAAKLEVICNGVDTQMFAPDAMRREAMRRQLKIRPDQLALLYVGDYTQPRKGLRTILQALVQTPQPILLYVVGGGLSAPYQQELDALADRVHFLGFRKDTPDLYRAADCFVYPSRYDTFSLVILEALASGTAVITTRESGFGELIASGQQGLILADPYDVSGLRNYLLNLYENPHQLQHLAQQGYRLAQDYTWTKMAQQYETLYQQIVSRSIS